MIKKIKNHSAENPFFRKFFCVCLPLSLFLISFASSLHAATMQKIAEDYFHELARDQDHYISYLYRTTLEKFDNDPETVFSELLDEVENLADPDALMMLSVLGELNPDLSPVDPAKTRDAVVQLLGEAEGNFCLAMHFLALTWHSTNTRQRSLGNGQASEYFLRSALAGHPQGMDGASLTRDGRTRLNKLPPLPREATELDRQTANLEGTSDKEGLYWVVTSSMAGNAKASASLGGEYIIRKEPEKALHYFKKSAHEGFEDGAGAVFGIIYKKPADERDCFEAIIYGALCARYESDGELIIDDRKNHETGADVGLWKEMFIKGDKKGIPACLTEEKYELAAIRSKEIYNAWKKKQDLEEKRLEALHDAASERLPAILPGLLKKTTTP